ncbi:hypothetical protein SAMN06265373_103103 [Shimia sagamensis]|uniref:Secreted protein n=1 Tax=Shimia sagamensis TaxID=1566352 RepID=A0ABY1NTG1_9RHOB|nr:hypothetical protein SAMN06265373_103103 [Shimia sagamensis]
MRLGSKVLPALLGLRICARRRLSAVIARNDSSKTNWPRLCFDLSEKFTDAYFCSASGTTQTRTELVRDAFSKQ